MAAPSSEKPVGIRKKAVLLALRLYIRELRRHRFVSLGALLLPALGSTCLHYLMPLAVGALVAHLAGGGDSGLATVLPYVLVFFALGLFAELLWRIGVHCLNRADGRGIEHLSVLGMDALLGKDAAFFHDNFAGSLTKRVLGFASRFEQFVDAVAFSVVANLIPLGFACVVLWTYHPLLVVVLLGLILITGLVVAPLIRRRQRLVDQREASYARVSGHVADTLANMETCARSPPSSARARSTAAGPPRTARWRCGPGTTATCASTPSSHR